MSRPDSSSHPEAEQQKPLALARDVAAVAGIFLFFAGFVYHFFLEQGIGLSRIGEVQFYQFVADSWTVFHLHPAAFGVATLAFLMIVLARELLRPRIPQSTRTGYDSVELAAIVMVTVGAFVYIFGTARATGLEVAERTRSGLESSSVEIVFSRAVRKRYPDLVLANNNEELRIVGRDNHYMYILDQPGQNVKPIPSAKTYAIRLQDIESYRMTIP